MSPFLISYIVQAAGALFAAVLFGFLSRTYRKPFLLHWARAASALCIMLFGSGLTISLADVASPTSVTRLVVSSVTLIAAYVHVAWLLFGAAELVSHHWTELIRKRRNWIFGVAIVFALASLAYHADHPDPFGPRFSARIALRSLIIGLAFIAAAVAVVVSRGEKPGLRLGRAFVGGSFALYAATQLHLSWLGAFNRAVISQSNYALYSGFIDFVLVFAMGLGIVIWLLEEEHTRVLSTTEEIAQLAYHDPLTGLPNRKLLLDHLTRAIYQARRDRFKLAVYFIDLDRFKVINDSLGHSAGDKVLQAVASRVTCVLREADAVARMGGDEFVFITTAIKGVEDAVHVAQKVRDAIREPLQIEGRELFVSCSMGIAVYPDDGESADTLVKNADTAMYRAKSQGNDLLQLYTPEMNAHAAEQLALESALRRAVETFEFELHYQPIVQTSDNQICSLETMLRWRHPVLGLVRPEQFIRLAESTGLIVPIGEWALRTSCNQLAEWRATGYRDLRLAVNISSRQLKESDFVATVRLILAETGVPASAVEFEITEMSATQSEPAIIDRLRALRDLGIRISIDDFGTGFSSVSVLRVFPVDALKIDTSFVRDLVLDPDDAAIAAAVVALAKSMGLTVIAEGVENPAQLEFLRAQGCEMWQGYLCCPPVQTSEVRTVLGRRSGGALRQKPTPSDAPVLKH
ncbi:MAG TPA: EAL domain-containing protein [Gemmatimonadaceae bacterium]|nr:EAL domain-containing protein [Gemmatimonadaceae bacterium]